MRYIGSVLAVGIVWIMAFAAQAEPPSQLRSLLTADDSKGWEAVGRLNLGTGAFCTGALIAEDIVLTAAHCLFDKESGRAFAASEIEFLAGWRDGRAQAYRGVRRAIPHPDYDIKSTDVNRIAQDLALIQLDRPIRDGRITPFATHVRPRKGDPVGVVSYAHNRAERPGLQELCHVLARQSGALILSCEVDYGSSGAPIFVLNGGRPQIVSVVSAMADVEDRRVSIGTSLEKPLADLLAVFAQSDGVFHRQTPPVRRPATIGSGAKFLRP